MESHTISIPTRAALIALASAGQAAFPVGRLHGRGLAAFVALPAVAAAGVGYAIATSQLPDASNTRRVGIAALAGGAIAAGQALNVVVDRAAMNWLAPRVSKPRLVWMAGSAVIGAASALIDARTNPPADAVSA